MGFRPGQFPVKLVVAKLAAGAALVVFKIIKYLAVVHIGKINNGFLATQAKAAFFFGQHRIPVFMARLGNRKFDGGHVDE